MGKGTTREMEAPMLPGLDSPLTGDVRNDRNTMLRPFFALTPGRTAPIEYRQGGVEISVQGTKAGIATIEDKDVVMYIISLIKQRRTPGQPVPQKFRFTAHDFFKATGKSAGGKSYRYFEQALERLQGTQIKTNIVTGGARERTWFSWFKSARMETAVRLDGKEAMKAIEVELCDWLWRAVVDDDATLVADDAHFKLPPMERKLCEIACAECEKDPERVLPLDELRRRMGVVTDLRRFRHVLGRILALSPLAGFLIEIVCRSGEVLAKPEGRVPLDRLHVRFLRLRDPRPLAAALLTSDGGLR